jgi:hypothetical protein
MRRVDWNKLGAIRVIRLIRLIRNPGCCMIQDAAPGELGFMLKVNTSER